MKPSDLGEHIDPPEPYERRNPLDRYWHLPVGTREWLEGLREDDIKEFEAMREMFRTLKALGKFGRWVVYTAVGAAALGAAFGENVLKLLGMTRGQP